MLVGRLDEPRVPDVLVDRDRAVAHLVPRQADPVARVFAHEEKQADVALEEIGDHNRLVIGQGRAQWRGHGDNRVANCPHTIGIGKQCSGNHAHREIFADSCIVAEPLAAQRSRAHYGAVATGRYSCCQRIEGAL